MFLGLTLTKQQQQKDKQQIQQWQQEQEEEERQKNAKTTTTNQLSCCFLPILEARFLGSTRVKEGKNFSMSGVASYLGCADVVGKKVELIYVACGWYW